MKIWGPWDPMGPPNPPGPLGPPGIFWRAPPARPARGKIRGAQGPWGPMGPKFTLFYNKIVIFSLYYYKITIIQKCNKNHWKNHIKSRNAIKTNGKPLFWGPWRLVGPPGVLLPLLGACGPAGPPRSCPRGPLFELFSTPHS